MQDDAKSKIEELEKELYSKDYTPHRVEDVLKHKEQEAVPEWNPSQTDEDSFQEDQARHHSIMKKFVKYSAWFFLSLILKKISIFKISLNEMRLLLNLKQSLMAKL